MKKVFTHILLIFFLLNKAFPQTIKVYEYESNTAVAEAMIIQNNKLLGSTNNEGRCNLKKLDIKSKVCIKTFGFLDTCFFLNGKDQTIYLNLRKFETNEVNIIAKEAKPKEQLLKFLTYSVSLSNQEKEQRSYCFIIEMIPDSVDAFDRMSGTFSYQHPSVKNRMKYKDLYQCHAEHTISKELVQDSIARSAMNRGTLPYTMMRFYHLCIPYVKAYKKHLNEDKLLRTISDSTFIFTYTDSTRYPAKYTWKFNKEGRLLEFESVQILEEADRSIGHYHGKRYSHLIYSKSGVLKPEYANIIQTYHYKTEIGYTSIIDIWLDSTECVREDVKNIPIGLSISTWAHMNNISTTIVE